MEGVVGDWGGEEAGGGGEVVELWGFGEWGGWREEDEGEGGGVEEGLRTLRVVGWVLRGKTKKGLRAIRKRRRRM